MTTGDETALGHQVVVLRGGVASGRLRASSTDVLLAVLRGEAEVGRGREPGRPLLQGQVTTVARGEAWSVCAPQERTTLLVVAHPAGVERVVAALCSDPPLPPHRRVELALEEGVELIL